jgi:hypothetical protein
MNFNPSIPLTGVERHAVMMSSIKCLTVYRPLIKAHPEKNFFNRAPMLWVEQQSRSRIFVSVAAGRTHWLWSNL